MAGAFQPDRAVRYAYSVLTDFRIGRLPVDPFRLAADAGISVLPLSAVRNHPSWAGLDLSARLRMNRVVTVTFPAFCIICQDDGTAPERLTLPLARELGHLFMNHYRETMELTYSGRLFTAAMESEADSFARNLLAPVPVVDAIRFHRPTLARASLFGLSRSAWLQRLSALDRDRASIDADMANGLLSLFGNDLAARL